MRSFWHELEMRLGARFGFSASGFQAAASDQCRFRVGRRVFTRKYVGRSTCRHTLASRMRFRLLSAVERRLVFRGRAQLLSHLTAWAVRRLYHSAYYSTRFLHR